MECLRYIIECNVCACLQGFGLKSETILPGIGETMLRILVLRGQIIFQLVVVVMVSLLGMIVDQLHYFLLTEMGTPFTICFA